MNKKIIIVFTSVLFLVGIYKGYSEAIKHQLIKEGIALVLAAEKGDLQAISQSVAKEPESVFSFDPNRKLDVLQAAAKEGKLEVVKFLIEHQYPQKYYDFRNKNFGPSLYLAIEQDHLDVAEYLLSNGFTPTSSFLW